MSRAIGSRRASAPAASSIAFSPKPFEETIWSGPGVLAGHDEFVAGGDQRHHRPAVHRHAAGVHRREQREVDGR